MSAYRVGDKYDEKAWGLCTSQIHKLCPEDFCPVCERNAAALREAAAEAYEDAAKKARDIGDISASDKINKKEIGKTSACSFLANRYDEAAAALRRDGGSK